MKNNFINRFKPYMEDEKKRFPEEYKLLVSFYKELEVIEKEEKKLKLRLSWRVRRD